MTNNQKSNKARIFFILALLAALGVVSLVQAQSTDIKRRVAVPAQVTANKLDSPVFQSDFAATTKLDPALASAEGMQTIFVRLNAASLSQVAGSAARGADLSQARASVDAQQAALVRTAQSLDGNAQLMGQMRNLLNGVYLQIDASALTALAANPNVASVSKVNDYELHLSETVPYIGGTAVQDLGFDGSGVIVAVLDSGVDYTHAALGGPGTLEAYQAAYGTSNADPLNTTRDGLFPTAKVIEGYDFVGEAWPNGPLAFDPDPIDFEGHGTHVADIIAGVGFDQDGASNGTGVAPGASLYGIKVCSAVSSSCSGVALGLGMDFAVDPNGDGDFSDAADVINMSLGSNYGTAYDDDLSLAVENATLLGTLTVSSAGNGSNKPFITGTPSSAPSALAVAQTAVPSALQDVMEVTAPAAISGIYYPVFQPWSVPLSGIIEAPVIYGDTDGDNFNGCAPFDGDLTGYVVLVDRGACTFSSKISNISQANGLVGIIGLIAPGDPFSGGDGGERPIDIPGYMISQADANALRFGLPDTTVRFDPANAISLAGTIVGSSSRGPSMGANLLKPEIGAPGASISAVAGSGTGTGAFGGTSGAGPMVAGSAALLMDAYPDRSWAEIKAVLMNTAETNITTTPDQGSTPLPISRIGGGEVRVDRALASPSAAWDDEALSGGLSMGFNDIARSRMTFTKVIRVMNYSDEPISYRVSNVYRPPLKGDSWTVQVSKPSLVVVPANDSKTFKVRFRVVTPNLPDWIMNGGSGGADATLLDAMEFDGYILLEDPTGNLTLPWHILPRKAGDIQVRDDVLAIDRELDGIPAGRTTVVNRGQALTTVSAYSLIATSDDLPEGGPGEQSPTPDFKYVGYRTIPVPAGFCSGSESFVMEFAVNTWERQTLPLTTSFWFHLDMDLDPSTGGGPFGSEYSVLNRDLSLNNITDGRNVTWVIDWSTGAAGAFFFTGHQTNSANTIMTICGDQIGMNASNFFQPFGVTAEATDFYYGGPGDLIDGMVISPLGEQYLGVFAYLGDGRTIGTDIDLYPNFRERLWMLDFGPLTNNTETGLLLMANNGSQTDMEAQIVLAEGNEE